MWKLLNQVNVGLSLINQHSSKIAINRDTLKISNPHNNIADIEEYDLSFKTESDNYLILGLSSTRTCIITKTTKL